MIPEDDKGRLKLVAGKKDGKCSVNSGVNSLFKHTLLHIFKYTVFSSILNLKVSANNCIPEIWP